MVVLIAPRVSGLLPMMGDSRVIATSTKSDSGAVSSTMPLVSASAPPYRWPVVMAVTAVCGLSFAWIRAAIPGVKGMLMSTSGKQK